MNVARESCSSSIAERGENVDAPQVNIASTSFRAFMLAGSITLTRQPTRQLKFETSSATLTLPSIF